MASYKRAKCCWCGDPMLTDTDVHHFRRSLEWMRSNHGQAVLLLRECLSEICPELEEKISVISLYTFQNLLDVLISLMKQWSGQATIDVMKRTFREIARFFDVTEHDIPALRQSILATLSGLAGSSVPDEVQLAWEKIFTACSPQRNAKSDATPYYVKA